MFTPDLVGAARRGQEEQTSGGEVEALVGAVVDCHSAPGRLGSLGQALHLAPDAQDLLHRQLAGRVHRGQVVAREAVVRVG